MELLLELGGFGEVDEGLRVFGVLGLAEESL